MATTLRFLMLLTISLWLGGIVFFAGAVAPALFSTLPSRELAGAVVTRSLAALHWMGIVAGVVFIACSMLSAVMAPQRFATARAVLVALMLALTCASQFGVARKMSELRREMGVIDDVAATDQRRVSFNRLHQWSTRLEGSVLVLGVAVLYLLARE
jgi:hypothetical protein